MGYPAAPWRMQGQLWLSLFRVRGVEGRPDGVYGAAFVDYPERRSCVVASDRIKVVDCPVEPDKSGPGELPVGGVVIRAVLQQEIACSKEVLCVTH